MYIEINPIYTMYTNWYYYVYKSIQYVLCIQINPMYTLYTNKYYVYSDRECACYATCLS